MNYDDRSIIYLDGFVNESFEFMYLNKRLLIVRLRFVSNSLNGNYVAKQVSYVVYGWKQLIKILEC